MGIFNSFTGFKHASFALETNLAERAPTTTKTVATAQSDGPDAYVRIDRKRIENLYLTDPQTFNTIDLYVSIPLQSGFRIEAINKTNQKQYDDFFNNMGRTGMQLGLRQFMGRLLNDCPLYGYAYAERIFDRNEQGKVRLVDLKPVDAKLMDYARDNDNLIMVDESQRPLGYSMKIGFSAFGSNATGDEPPKGIKLNSDQIFLDKERIACILFKPFGNGFESSGIVEPAVLDIERKIKIKTAVANTIHNSAAYPVYAIVGDGQRSASKKVMEDTLTALQNFSYNRFGVFQHPTQLATLPIEHSPQADEHLRFLRSEQSTAGGVALGIAVGSGEAINRQTMGEQQVILDMKFDGWLERFNDQFKKQILDYLYEYNEYGSKANIFWNDVSLDDKIEKAKILLLAGDKNVLSPEEIRKYIINAYDISEDRESYDKMINDQEKEAKLAAKNVNNGMQEKKKVVSKPASSK